MGALPRFCAADGIMIDPSVAIREVIRADWARPIPDSVFAVAEALQERHKPAVGAVLFYGSCLRTGSDDGVLDLYLLVDSYDIFYSGHRFAAWANRLLPPNVFYFELPRHGRTLRTKYAVISFEDFAFGAGPKAILPAIWARFSQPTELLHASNKAAEAKVESALAQAVATMALHTAPLIIEPVDPLGFWTAGYARSYQAEARVEGPGRAKHLVEPPSRYQTLLRPALNAAGVAYSEAGEGRVNIVMSESERKRGISFWARAGAASRLHSIPRLAKAAFTFEGGVDYALWKVERHSGVKVEASPWQRRHPLVAALPLLWRAYRKGAFRRA
jgi:hypothetical protein